MVCSSTSMSTTRTRRIFSTIAIFQLKAVKTSLTLVLLAGERREVRNREGVGVRRLRRGYGLTRLPNLVQYHHARDKLHSKQPSLPPDRTIARVGVASGIFRSPVC